MRIAVLCLFMVFSARVHAQNVKIAAASNLRFVLDEIKFKYREVNPKANMVINLGGQQSFSLLLIGSAVQPKWLACGYHVPCFAD